MLMRAWDIELEVRARERPRGSLPKETNVETEGAILAALQLNRTSRPLLGFCECRLLISNRIPPPAVEWHGGRVPVRCAIPVEAAKSRAEAKWVHGTREHGVDRVRDELAEVIAGEWPERQ